MEWNLPEREDRMSHVADVISVDVTLSAYQTLGKPDKRFKCGYRDLPQIVHSPVINIEVGRKEQYKLGQIWHIGKFDDPNRLGKYAVTIIWGDKVRLIPVTMSNCNGKHSLRFTPTIDMLYFGSRFPEGLV